MMNGSSICQRDVRSVLDVAGTSPRHHDMELRNTTPDMTDVEANLAGVDDR
jgi:hypothetical protein